MQNPATQMFVLLTENDPNLHEVMVGNLETLQQLAYYTLHTLNLGNTEFTVVCVEVCHSTLDPIADSAAGKHDWEKYRQEGFEPVARAVHRWDFCERIARAVPYKESELLKPPEDGMAKLIVIGITGVSVYEIVPRPPCNAN